MALALCVDWTAWRRRVQDLQRTWADEQPVELVQTHISAVLLGQRHVLKLKKPVNFGFLDYSSLEQRRAACEAEVRLNGRLAPDTYLGVKTIHESNGEASFEGPGEVVDYAVLMKRLPADRMLDAMLARGDVPDALVQRIAARLAQFHADSPRTPEIEHWGDWEQIRGQWQENFDQTRPYIGRTIDAETFQTIEAWVQRELAAHRDLFARRVSERRIVDGHGDLRCESICVPDPAPGQGAAPIVFFDCVEFSDRLRCCDAASEIAFLAMDMAARGRADLAFVLVEHYVDASSDAGIRALTAFYCCYRAWVRGKVLSFRLDEAEFADEQKQNDALRASAFFTQALRYTQPLTTPTLIAVTGLSGTGKTTLARAIAHELGSRVISADKVRHDLLGDFKQPAAFGQGAYSAEATLRTYSELLSRGLAQVAASGSAIVDGTFVWPEQRVPFISAAEAARVELRWIECQLSPEVARERIEHRQARQAHGRAAGHSDADWQIYLHQRELYEANTESLPADRLSVDTGAPLSLASRQACDWLRKSKGK